jgi:hypothetical protein
MADKEASGPVVRQVLPQYVSNRQGKEEEIPAGMCQCGCGQPAPLAMRTSKRHGTVKGQPQRFILGHRWRKTLDNFREEDRGYKTPCWIWQGRIAKSGYGTLGRRYVHRLMFARANGPIPEGLEPDHLCRVRACGNPDHMEAVTRSENMKRSPLVGRWKREKAVA